MFLGEESANQSAYLIISDDSDAVDEALAKIRELSGPPKCQSQ